MEQTKLIPDEADRRRLTDQSLEHLVLPHWRTPLPRRKHGGGRPPGRERSVHGRQLLQEATEVANKLSERRQNAPENINPKLIFKLILHQKGNLEASTLERLGLRVLGKDARKAYVVFPSEENLDKLRRHLAEYAGLVENGHTYGELAAIEQITELSRDDRIGPHLAAQMLGPSEIAFVDIELWHTGDNSECRRNIDAVRMFLEPHNLQVTDSYVSQTLCLLRAQLTRETLDVLTSGEIFDFVKEVERRPQPTFDFGDVRRIALEDFVVVTDPVDLGDDLIGVIVIDSGITSLHPVLSPAVGDAQVFSDRLKEKITGGPEDGDTRNGGHGTAVAGFAVYGDVNEGIVARRFVPSAMVFSARVTDDQNQYDETELTEHQLASAVEYFLDHYRNARVINISLGNRDSVYSDGKYQLRLAATIDDLAYLYRDRNIVFVVSSGNYMFDGMDSDDVKQEYPDYLLESEKARIIDPAGSAIAITVGGLSNGAGRDSRDDWRDREISHLIAGQRQWPSPFTRAGWGHDGAIKPDVVDFAGDLKWDKGRIPEPPVEGGLPTTAKTFAAGSLFRTVAGTSFAAPRIANLAARLMRDFPDASSNLIRCLIADSARVPENRPQSLTTLKSHENGILRIYGYGQPDYARARASRTNRAALIADGTMTLDTFELFSIPGLPEEFFPRGGTGYISVTLAFDPPTRHTRADSYMGVAMDFSLYRNTPPEEIAKVYRSWEVSELEKLGIEKADQPTLTTLRNETEQIIDCHLLPGPMLRNRGTLQRGVIPISRNWKYDGNPLVLAVACRRKWAPAEIVSQRYAVVVSVYHDNEQVDIYNALQAQTQIYQRTRVRITT